MVAHTRRLGIPLVRIGSRAGSAHDGSGPPASPAARGRGLRRGPGAHHLHDGDARLGRRARRDAHGAARLRHRELPCLPSRGPARCTASQGGSAHARRGSPAARGLHHPHDRNHPGHDRQGHGPGWRGRGRPSGRRRHRRRPPTQHGRAPRQDRARCRHLVVGCAPRGAGPDPCKRSPRALVLHQLEALAAQGTRALEEANR